MKKNRTQSEDASISFLDVICCGFGAIVLLMMITRTMPPHSLEQAVPEEGRVADLQAALFEIRGETTVLNRDMTVKQEQLSEYLEKIAILTQQFNAMAAAMNDSGGEEDERSSELEKLQLMTKKFGT